MVLLLGLNTVPGVDCKTACAIPYSRKPTASLLDNEIAKIRAGINHRHDQSGLRKRKLVSADSTMTDCNDGLAAGP